MRIQHCNGRCQRMEKQHFLNLLRQSVGKRVCIWVSSGTHCKSLRKASLNVAWVFLVFHILSIFYFHCLLSVRAQNTCSQNTAEVTGRGVCLKPIPTKGGRRFCFIFVNVRSRFGLSTSENISKNLKLCFCKTSMFSLSGTHDYKRTDGNTSYIHNNVTREVPTSDASDWNTRF